MSPHPPSPHRPAVAHLGKRGLNDFGRKASDRHREHLFLGILVRSHTMEWRPVDVLQAHKREPGDKVLRWYLCDSDRTWLCCDSIPPHTTLLLPPVARHPCNYLPDSPCLGAIAGRPGPVRFYRAREFLHAMEWRSMLA